MSILVGIFHEGLFRPLLNLLVFLYETLGDFGLAIIVVTALVRLMLYPIAKKTLVHQKELKKIQPKIKELQEKHKDDKETLSKEMMALYKEHNFNPASGCLPMIVQLIVLIALYRVFLSVMDLRFEELYSWMTNPGKIDTYFFNLFDLGHKSAELNLGKILSLNFSEGIKIISWGGVLLSVIAGAAQFFQTKMTIAKQKAKKAEEEKEGPGRDVLNTSIENGKKEEEKSGEPDMMEIMNKQMLYFFPFLTIYIGLTFPAGLSLYWVVSTLLLIGQQYLLDREDKI